MYVFTDILRKQLKLSHPDTEGVSHLFGTIMTDGNDENLEEITDTICVFAEREVGHGNVGFHFETMKNSKFFRTYLERSIINPKKTL